MSDNDLVSLKSGEINSISDTEHDSEKGGAVDLFADVFEEKESLVKLTSIVEKRIEYQLVMNLQQCHCVAEYHIFVHEMAASTGNYVKITHCSSW